MSAEVVDKLCEMTGHPCAILWNTTLVYERYPKDWTHFDLPLVCFNIWGNHGFFYKRQASDGIKNMRVQMPKDLRSEKLVQIADDDDRTKYADMKPYTMEAFLEAYKSKKAQVFYTSRLNDIAEELDNAHVTYYTQWKDLGPLDRPQRAALSKAWSKKNDAHKTGTSDRADTRSGLRDFHGTYATASRLSG